jgi:hypothetical protein
VDCETSAKEIVVLDTIDVVMYRWKRWEITPAKAVSALQTLLDCLLPHLTKMQFLQSAGAPFRRNNWRPPFSGSSLHRGWLRWLPVLSRQRRRLWKLLGLEMADRKLEGSLCRMVSRGKIKIKSWENRLKRRPESVI